MRKRTIPVRTRTTMRKRTIPVRTRTTMKKRTILWKIGQKKGQRLLGGSGGWRHTSGLGLSKGWLVLEF